MLKALKDRGRDGGKVAIITGALHQGIAPRRVNGFREALKANPKVEIVAVEDARWDTAISEGVAGQFYACFAATGGLDVVYGMADNQAAAAIRAAGRTAPKQFIVVGGNCLKEGLDAIKTGKMQATVTQISTDLGVRAADVINEYFGGNKLPKLILSLSIVTKANVAQQEAPCTY